MRIYAIQLEDIMYGKKETDIRAFIDLGGDGLHYSRSMIRNNG